MGNKKGFVIGWQWIVGFFFVMLLFFLLIGITDIVKVEFFSPASDLVRNLTVEISGNDSVYVLKQNTLHNDVEGINLPYNLILMFITAYMILMSVVDVIQNNKQGFTSLLFGTIGGTIFLIYVFQLLVIGMLDWANIEIIGKLFGTLIDDNAPFYNVLFDNWYFIFIWALVLATANRVFGKESNEELF